MVRVEADATQRLWKFPLAGGKPILVLEKIKPVGYQAWIDQNTLALFILGAAGKPSTLQIVDVRTEKAEVIAEKYWPAATANTSSEQAEFCAQDFG